MERVEKAAPHQVMAVLQGVMAEHRPKPCRCRGGGGAV